MFELPGGRDVSAELAALGAGTNAFTSHDMTAYYIGCTENFEEALKLLLEFVSTPYFTEESVQKEIGIIDQEIGMDADSPDSACFKNLMTSLYREHPVRVDVLESLAERLLRTGLTGTVTTGGCAGVFPVHPGRPQHIHTDRGLPGPSGRSPRSCSMTATGLSIPPAI